MENNKIIKHITKEKDINNEIIKIEPEEYFCINNNKIIGFGRFAEIKQAIYYDNNNGLQKKPAKVIAKIYFKQIVGPIIKEYCNLLYLEDNLSKKQLLYFPKVKGIHLAEKYDGSYDKKLTNSNILFITKKRGMDLMDYLDSRNGIFGSLRECKLVIYKICKQIKKIHDIDMAHTDIRLENIIYNNRKSKISIIDFGYADIIEKENILIDIDSPPNGNKIKNIANFTYKAPEFFFGAIGYDLRKSDIYSLGHITHSLLTGYFLYRNKYGKYINKYKLDAGSNRFLKKTLHVNHIKRYNINMALNDSWFDDIKNRKKNK